MTLSLDLTPTQEAAIIELRKAWNQGNPHDIVTAKQFGERLILACIESATDGYYSSALTELKPAYRAATPEVKTQVRTLLGI